MPKERPMITVWGLRNVDNLPWTRHATDEDLRFWGYDPAEYEPRDETKDRWG